MKKCELCNEEVPKDQTSCSRCGFDFPPEVRADKRDKSILKKHDGKPAGEIKRDLSERFSKYVSYFENLGPDSSRPDEFSAFVEEAVAHLHIPIVIGMGDEMKFSEKEVTVIKTIARRLLDPQSANLLPRVRTETFMRLSNAMYCLKDPTWAMSLVELAIQRNPNDADALFNKAKLLFYDKKYDKAKAFLNKVKMKDPEREDAQYLAEMLAQLS